MDEQDERLHHLHILYSDEIGYERKIKDFDKKFKKTGVVWVPLGYLVEKLTYIQEEIQTEEKKLNMIGKAAAAKAREQIRAMTYENLKAKLLKSFGKMETAASNCSCLKTEQ
tara:strand:- start:242 stop:577 length:336 start_codon:yes stop_codon:yes gene_type:complete